MAIDWNVVRHSTTRKPIGALGFIDDKIAVITAFFEDKDWDNDGRVDKKERFLSMFTMKHRALAEVANQAYADPDILIRDPYIYNLRGQLTVQFASGLILEGIYKVYFSASISRAAGAAAGLITQNAVKSFLIKKGMEKAVETAYKASIGH